MSSRPWVQAVMAIALIGTCAALAAAQETASPSVVITEVEVNPAGFDTSAEWVELLNTGDETVDLAGWAISYSYRGPGALPITGASLSLPPGGRLVFVYPGLRLRNAGSTAISLFDSEGILVDQTPAMPDAEDDGGTWQRFPDGGDPNFPGFWLFLPATRNAVNE